MAGTADLSTILNPPRGFTLQYGQARVIAWDAKTGHNTVEWAGTSIHDVSVLADINALTIRSNDVVGMLGWTSPEGVSSWWVLGRIVSPGEGATDLVIYGSLIVGNGGAFSALYPSGQPGAFFGPLHYEATGLPSGHGLLVQADDSSAFRDVFCAEYQPDGSRVVLIGQTPGEDASGAVDRFIVDAVQVGVHSHGDDLLLQSHHGGAVKLYGGESISGGGDIIIHAFAGGDVDALAWDGEARFGGIDGTFIAPESGAGNAEVRMNSSSGRLTYVPISSTARVKRDIQDLDVDVEAVLRLRPRSWLPAPVERQCPEWMHAQHSGEECHGGEVIEPPGGGVRQVGFIAEELDEIGLGDFVQYDDEGLPAAISYDRLAAALVPVLQSQQAQIEALAARLDALEQLEEGS